jgi:hypothetical protein
MRLVWRNAPESFSVMVNRNVSLVTEARAVLDDEKPSGEAVWVGSADECLIGEVWLIWGGWGIT